MDLSEKLLKDKKQSTETRSSKVTPSMEEKGAYHPPDVLRRESYSEKTRFRNTALSGKRAEFPVLISVSLTYNRLYSELSPSISSNHVKLPQYPLAIQENSPCSIPDTYYK